MYKITGFEKNAEIEEYFEHIFEGTGHVQKGLIEVRGREAILKYQLKYTNKKILLYGAGRIGFITLFWLKQEGILPEYIIDVDPSKAGSYTWGVEIKNISELQGLIKDRENEYILILAVNLGQQQNVVKRQLFQMGITEIMDISLENIYDTTPIGIIYELYNAKKDFLELLKIFGDMKSKEIICEYLRTYFYNDFFRLAQEASSEKYWGNGIFATIEDETFVCLGGGSGDTIYYFLDKYNDKFDKIYCFEPENIHDIKHNLSVLPMNISEKIEYIELYAANETKGKNVKLDDIFRNKKVTLISMDIEGMELEALKGARNLIKNQMPILAISAYHKWDDMIQFVHYIKELNHQYCFYFRKYAALHRMNRNEIVLYAVPKERIISK